MTVNTDGSERLKVSTFPPACLQRSSRQIDYVIVLFVNEGLPMQNSSRGP